MKRTVKVKNLIAFAAVLILLFSITAIPAYAEFPPLTTAGRRMGSWVLSALTALNITLTSTASTSQGADLINFLADPLDVTYSYSEAWADRPTIQIWEDYVTIDGQSYTDIWLSNEAASKFKTNGMDFATAYDIASQTNGTFVSGEGYYDGVPIFNDNNELVSQFYTQYVPTFTEESTGFSSVGYGTIQGVKPIRTSGNGWVRYAPSTGNFNQLSFPQGTVGSMQLVKRNQNEWLMRSPSGASAGGFSNGLFVSNPFDFDWVAGTIDPTPLPSDQGMMIRVPSNTPGLDTFINDNPDFADDDGTTIDINIDPDIMTKLDDLIDIIAPIIPILNTGDINFTVNHTEPQPQPQPDPAPDVDPDTPVTDITYNDYYQTITNQTEYINNTVQNIDNSINTVNNNITEVNDSLDLIENYTENIMQDTAHIDAGVVYISQDTQVMVENQDTIIDNQDTIINNQDQIITNQDSIISNQEQIVENQDTIINDSIPEIIDNIPKIDEICNNIDTAPYHDLDTGLDHLPSIFLPFITDLRSALGIWHYVTEWIAQISTTFAFVTGCLAGTTIMTPIYAAIAGFMCIKVYRRMTG